MTRAKPALAAVLRGVLAFFLFGATVTLCRAIFFAGLFDEEARTLRAVHIVFLGLSLLIFESIVFTLRAHRPPSSSAERLHPVLDFSLEFAAVALLSALHPPEFAYSSAQALLTNGETPPSQGAVLALVLPLLLVLSLLAHLTARQRPRKSEDAPRKQTVFCLLKAIGIYLAASLLLPWAMPFLLTLLNVPGISTVLLVLILLIVGGALALWLITLFRAVARRRSFLCRLEQLCREKQITHSPIRAPYRSLILPQAGADFTLTTARQTYACKLVNGMLRSSPICFTDTGHGTRQTTLRLFRTEVFHWLTLVDCTMPDDLPRLLLVLPCPNQIFVSENKAPPRRADTGEVVGQYTVYNATGLLGALERDLL